MLSIANTTKQKVGRVAHFSSIAKDILGSSYELSLVFIGNRRSQTLNRTYRDKDYPTNVLSFPLDTSTGEIFINLDKVKVEKKDFDMNTQTFITYLFIHGLLHLKGHDHGKKMEALEEKYLQKYS